MDPLKPGIYEHFKGKRYEVMGVALPSETMEPMVVYKALYEGDYPQGPLWVRPLAMFSQSVLVNGQSAPRFKHLPNP